MMTFGTLTITLLVDVSHAYKPDARSVKRVVLLRQPRLLLDEAQRIAAEFRENNVHLTGTHLETEWTPESIFIS